jgi:hypothetical protein
MLGLLAPMHPFLQPQPTLRLRDLFSYEWDEIYHAPLLEKNDDQTIS